MKTKLLKIWNWIRTGLLVLIVLVVAIVCLAFLGELEERTTDMSDIEKEAYAKGQYDAMQGDFRIQQVDSTKYEQTASFIDGDERFNKATFVLKGEK